MPGINGKITKKYCPLVEGMPMKYRENYDVSVKLLKHQSPYYQFIIYIHTHNNCSQTDLFNTITKLLSKVTHLGIIKPFYINFEIRVTFKSQLPLTKLVTELYKQLNTTPILKARFELSVTAERGWIGIKSL
jgi:hypothetical protein